MTLGRTLRQADRGGLDFGGRRVTFPDLLREAEAISGWLLEEGLRPGETVGLAMPTSAELVGAFFGVSLAGGVPFMIPPPPRLSRVADYPGTVARMVQKAGAALTIGGREPARTRLGHRERPQKAAPRTREGGPDDLALVQFSSGTTGEPRPVPLTHRAVLANVRAILAELPGRVQDHSGVTWLPLYHDMGLVGCLLTAVAAPGDLTLLKPEEFVVRPARWLQALSRTRATVSPAPNFALHMCVQRVTDEEMRGVDLSAWTMALVGAETVRPATLQAFAARFAPFGFRPEALTPVYGLAEATLAVTFTPAGRGPRISHGAGRPLVSVGRPVQGVQVRIRGDGRVLVKGPSVMHDGWLDTGDQGYLEEGELFLTGRARDLLIVRGRNHEPEPLEEAAGAPAAAAVALEGEDTERVCLMLEMERGSTDDPQQTARRAREAVALRTGLTPGMVVVLEPGALPRTSSGKIRRSQARLDLLAGHLDAWTRARLDGVG